MEIGNYKYAREGHNLRADGITVIAKLGAKIISDTTKMQAFVQYSSSDVYLLIKFQQSSKRLIE